MIQELSSVCYSIFIVLALISTVLPIFLMWRAASLSAIFLVAAKMLEGPVHWSDQNAGYALGLAILTIFVSIIVGFVIARLVFAEARNSLDHDTLVGPKNRLIVCLDIVGLSILGIVFGLYLSIWLTRMLSGIEIGNGLDIGVTLFSIIFAFFFLLLQNRKLGFAVSSIFATVAVVALVGSQQPTRIVNNAEMLADGQAWCLVTSDDKALISRIGQLGFFSLPKVTGYPHLGLMVQNGERPQLVAHWSIRQQRFIEIEKKTTRTPTCYPIKDYASKINAGTVKDHLYFVGPMIYSVPKEYHPRAYNDRLSIRSDIVVGPRSNHPELSERVEVIYDLHKPDIPDDAIPITTLPSPEELDIDELSGKNRLVFAGDDQEANQFVIIRCLSGLFSDFVCGMEVFKDSVSYSFYLPIRELHRWSEASDKVDQLFKKLQFDKNSDSNH